MVDEKGNLVKREDNIAKSSENDISVERECLKFLYVLTDFGMLVDTKHLKYPHLSYL